MEACANGKHHPRAANSQPYVLGVHRAAFVANAA